MYSLRPIATVPPLLLAIALIAGCAPEPENMAAATNEPKENKVEFVVLTHPVNFQLHSPVMQPSEEQALAAFLSKVDVGYGDRVTVGQAPARGVPESLASRRRASVLLALRRHNVRVGPLGFPGSGAASADAADGAVMVRVSRYVVTGPPCPDWRKPEAADFTNTPTSNFGCATVTDLGLMVADPSELVHGSPAGAADGEFAARAVELYRSGALSKSIVPDPPLEGSGGGKGSGGAE